MRDDPELRSRLLFLLGGKRGGESRARIIQIIRATPRNLNQLTNDMCWEYKSVQHHVRVLVSNSLLVSSGKRYGSVYKLSPWFENHMEMFEEMYERMSSKKLAESNR
jgi:predicted transcriptional regulator